MLAVDQDEQSAQNNNSTIPCTIDIQKFYVCIICGAAWESPHAFRAHFKKHIHNKEAVEVSFHAPTELYHRFKQLVTQSGSTICHELVGYMAARVAASQRAPVKYSANPGFKLVQITIHKLIQRFGGSKPRSKLKYQL